MPGIYDSVKRFFTQVTEMGLLLIALSVVAGIIFGADLPFVGNVVGNLIALIKSLGDSGLIGLIAVGIILWLLSKRS
jgi:ABC-type enterochelin transport system permease subunit